MVLGNHGHGNETERGYLWMLVGMDLNPVASVTVLLTETCYILQMCGHTLTEPAHAVFWFESFRV